MTLHSRIPHRLLSTALLLAVAALASACGSGRANIPTGITDADKFLYERGVESLESKRWFTAREYFGRLIDNYPQSPHRPEAKLGLADAYLGEGTTESLVLAVNEYKEFLTFYPTHRRADYAQYKLGMTHHRQMRGPERDQTETREAVREFETFVERYPNSELMPEVRERLREARDRLSTSEYRVGYFYYRQRWYPGAIDRLRTLLTDDPGYTNRDAVYYYLAESLVRVNRQAEALPYYDRLVKEFDTSEYLARAQKRLQEFQALTPPAEQPAAGTPAEGTPAPPASPAPPETATTTPTSTPPRQ
jgi:outer membrane protein assembly factor BamD